MKTIFWNVDTQYDFMRKGGALYVPNAEEIEENLSELTLYALEHNIQVVNSADWHTLQSKEFSDKPDFKETFPVHCVQDTDGARFVSSTEPFDASVYDSCENLLEGVILHDSGRKIYAPYNYLCLIDYEKLRFDEKRVKIARNIVIYKDDFDVFKGNPHTNRVLEILQPQKVIVYGVATDVCVNYAVQGLLKRGLKVDVVEDAIKELPGSDLEKIFSRWRNNGARLITTNDVLEGRI